MSTYEQNRCPICGEQLVRLIPIGAVTKPVHVQCRCRREKLERELAERRRQQFLCDLESMERRYNITDRAYTLWRFEGDDSPDSAASRVCRRYVENWEDMCSHGTGLLLYGSVGTGKTFLSSAVVNALQARQHTATVTSFPRLLNLLQGSPDRQGLVDHLCTYELLVIDDLGVERDSTYAMEQVYAVLDARARSGKPLIITTNLSLQELKNPASTAQGRIYDRVLQMCPITLKMTGPSRRQAQAEEARARARKALLGT